MRRTPRTALVAMPAVCLLAALLFQHPHHEAPAVSPADPVQPATIEPGLPLRLDLTVREARPREGEPARVEAVVDASADLTEVSLRWVLPEGLQQEIVEESSPIVMRLRSGERRVLSVPVRAAKQADFPIRLEASFRVADGRRFRTEQGVLWRRRTTAPEGRHHAGAHEVMGVPVAEPLP